MQSEMFLGARQAIPMLKAFPVADWVRLACIDPTCLKWVLTPTFSRWEFGPWVARGPHSSRVVCIFNF